MLHSEEPASASSTSAEEKRAEEAVKYLALNTNRIGGESDDTTKADADGWAEGPDLARKELTVQSGHAATKGGEAGKQPSPSKGFGSPNRFRSPVAQSEWLAVSLPPRLECHTPSHINAVLVLAFH